MPLGLVDLHGAGLDMTAYKTKVYPPTPPIIDGNIPCYHTNYVAIAKQNPGTQPHSMEIIHPTSGHAYKVIDPDMGQDVEYAELLSSSESYLWEESCAEAAGRLPNSYNQSTGTNNIKIIHHE